MFGVDIAFSALYADIDFRRNMKVFCTALLLFALFALSNGLGCLDDNGNSVDW